MQSISAARARPWELGAPIWRQWDRSQPGTAQPCLSLPGVCLCAPPGRRQLLELHLLLLSRMWLGIVERDIYGAPRTCKQELGVNQELVAFPLMQGR